MIYLKLKNNKQLGAVSLFVVIFAALLMTVITISFVRIMIQDQQQATASDLAKSAYDSALAGVEDGKRALLRAQSICSSPGGDCSGAFITINSDICNAAVGTLSDISGISGIGFANEVKVQTDSTNSLDQAYTCVKIKADTPDYLGELAQDTSKLIPLVGLYDFNKIKIEWFSPKDLPPPASTLLPPTPAVSLLGSGTPLLNQDDWPANRPPIMRAQLIQFDDTAGFNLGDFEGAGNKGYNNTLFLYPLSPSSTGLNFFYFANGRKAPTFSPSQVKCESSLASISYSCSAVISLNKEVSAGAKTAYLNLGSIYNKANYKITLWNNSDTIAVNFKNVQPEIDSTGRANDYFKRVSTRVEMSDTNFPYPAVAIAINGSFCKDFIVTDNPGDYSASTTCTP